MTALFLDEYAAACEFLETTSRLEADRSLDDLQFEARVAGARRVFHEAIERAAKARKCRACGCTEDDCELCIRRTGQPCHWIEINLCSACVMPLKPREGVMAP